MTTKEQIKLWFETHHNEWISTRDLRTKFGEAADRRTRELRHAGFEIISKRREMNDGTLGFTFYWQHPTQQRSLL